MIIVVVGCALLSEFIQGNYLIIIISIVSLVIRCRYYALILILSSKVKPIKWAEGRVLVEIVFGTKT